MFCEPASLPGRARAAHRDGVFPERQATGEDLISGDGSVARDRRLAQREEPTARQTIGQNPIDWSALRMHGFRPRRYPVTVSSIKMLSA